MVGEAEKVESGLVSKASVPEHLTHLAGTILRVEAEEDSVVCGRFGAFSFLGHSHIWKCNPDFSGSSADASSLSRWLLSTSSRGSLAAVLSRSGQPRRAAA